MYVWEPFPCRSTSDQIFLLQTAIEKALREGKKLYAAFIDFRKAYDTVDRALLLGRLKEIGVDGILFRNIASMYSKTLYSIKLPTGSLNPISSNY